jgi:hypothetical protein
VVAARAADKELDTRDAFATAVELSSGRLPDGPLTAAAQRRAATLAAGRKAAEAVRLRMVPRRLALSGVLGLLAVGLAVVPNHQDDVRARKAAEQALARAEAENVRKAAEALPKKADGKKSEAARQLEALARELERAQSLDRAKAAVNRTAATLGQQLSKDFLAEKAAVRGLERSLAARPLPGGAGSAAEQLQQAAAALAGLSAEEQAKLAERLSALAAAQAVGNPEAASALEAAAGALREGDAGVAATALGQASSAQATATSSVAGQEAAASALGDLAAVQASLAAGPPSEQQAAGAGQGQGQGSGSGKGSGQGQGQGQGSGQGQGQGQGSGGQGGGGSGKVGGAKGAGGQGGTGGAGTADGSGANASVGLQEQSVFDPDNPTGPDGEQLNLGGSQGQGRDRTIGKGQGPTAAGGTRIPLSQALPRYSAQATRALEGLNIPPSLRALVRAYFDSLATEGETE